MSLDDDANAGKDALKGRRIHLREISGDTDGPLETVGQDLRAARLRRGDEIAAVSRALKIRKDHLEALEEDRIEDLPGKTYAIGFVRSYSRHLGLDAGQYVERFKQDISGRPDETQREPAPIHQDERRMPYGWRLVAGVVVLLLAYGGYHLLSSGGDAVQPTPPAPVLNPPKPPAPAPKPIVAPVQEAVPSPAADGAMPGMGSASSAAPNEQQATAMPPPAAGSPAPATRATPLASTTSPVAAQPGQAAVPAVPAASGGTVYGQQNKASRVVLRARGDSRVTVRAADGTLFINRDLKAGDVYQVPNTPGLNLAVSDAGALEVDLDGIALGRAGQQAQVIGRMSLDPQSLVDRFNH